MNKEVLSQSLLTEYMLLQHKYSMLLKSLGYRHPTDDDVAELNKMEHRLEVLREVFKQEITMVECIYRKDNIDLTYDTNEDLYYISVDGGDETGLVYCTKDYAKEELISILKEMVETLEDIGGNIE